jgi:predicted acylesterase/phospholipase RssA
LYKNLVLESGSIKGLATLGTLYNLQVNNKINSIQNFAGTSIGGIICTLLVLGYTPIDLYQEFYKVDLNSLVIDPFYKVPINLFKGFGLYKGDKFISFLENLFKQKNFSKDTTFEELFQKTKKLLVLTTTSLSSRDTLYFNTFTTPTFKVLEAVRLTMSIPGIFTANKCTINNLEHTCVDGAVLMGFPYYYFETEQNFGLHTFSEIKKLKVEQISGIVNEIPISKNYKTETLGVKFLDFGYSLDSQYYSGNKILNFKSFILNFIDTITTKIEKDNLKKIDDALLKNIITINIPAGISSTNFKMTTKEKADLFDIGYKSSEKFIANL